MEIHDGVWVAFAVFVQVEDADNREFRAIQQFIEIARKPFHGFPC
jgi:hypothetical protein